MSVLLIFPMQVAFTGNYNEYFGYATDVDAIIYLMLVNDMIHGLYLEAVTIGEDVSGDFFSMFDSIPFLCITYFIGFNMISVLELDSCLLSPEFCVIAINVVVYNYPNITSTLTLIFLDA